MAYTVCNQFGEPNPIRLVSAHADGSIFVGAAFTPVWWSCDPCNHSSERYVVDFGRHTQKYHWYEVLLSDDDERTVKVKTDFALAVARAFERVEQARREYRKLVG